MPNLLLTPEVQENIVYHLRKSSYFGTACKAAGIGERVAYRWKQKGEELEKKMIDENNPLQEPEKDRDWIYYQFYDACRVAEAEAEADDIDYIKKGKPHWQARAWIQERKHRERWAQRFEHTGADGKPLKMGVTIVAADKKQADLLQKVVDGVRTE